MPKLELPVVAAEGRGDGQDAIELRDLTVWFGAGAPGSVLAIERVSLSIQLGEFVSVVGPSGCGKTTILNLLTGLLPAHPEGEARPRQAA